MTTSGVRARLAGMMALVYGIQGAWYPLLSVHLDELGFSGRSRGWIFSTMAVGSIVAPIAVGRLADRRYAIDRLITWFYTLGTLLLIAIAVAGRSGAGPLAFFALFFAYWVLIAPAISLSTTLALRNLERPAEEFGAVRAAGTVGWMVAGWAAVPILGLLGDAGADRSAEAGFWLGAALSAVLAGFARFGLPSTPPLPDRSSAGPAAPRAARSRVRWLAPGVSTYLVTAFGVALTLPYMYQVMPPYLVGRGLGRPWVAAVMSLGQILEILALAFLPRLIRRYGFRRTLACGIGCWVARYAQLAADPPLAQAIAGTLLHGLGIACFSVAGQMYLDSHSPAGRRAEAQGLHTFVTSGAGVFLGSLIAGEFAAAAPSEGRIFQLPLSISAACLFFWLITAVWRRSSLVAAGSATGDARHPLAS